MNTNIKLKREKQMNNLKDKTKNTCLHTWIDYLIFACARDIYIVKPCECLGVIHSLYNHTAYRKGFMPDKWVM